MPISVVSHPWRSLHPNVISVRYSKGLFFTFVRVACHMKANELHVVLCGPIRRLSPLKVILSYYTTLLSNYISLSICGTNRPSDTKTNERKERGKQVLLTIFFILFRYPWWQAICPGEFLRNHTFVAIIRKKKPHPSHRRIFAYYLLSLRKNS